MHKTVIRCEACDDSILEGERIYYNSEEKDDGIDGEYRDGCGRCRICGRDLCSDCGGFNYDDVCADCRAEEEERELC
jgi:hypothetical protein